MNRAWLILVSVVFLGCGNGVSGELDTLAQSATELDFTTTAEGGGQLPSGQVPLDVTVTDPEKVVAFFQETLDLPAADNGDPNLHCFENGSRLFHMTFVSHAEDNGVSHDVETKMKLLPESNCSWVTIGSLQLQTNEEYWQHLAKTLGVSVAKF